MAPGVELLSFRPNLPVRDLGLALAFYRDLLGLDVVHQEEAFALLRSAGGAEVVLEAHPSPQAAGCYLYVRGVEALHARLADAGVRVERRLQRQPWGLLDFVAADPDGHRIGIGEWQ
jgi:catechol 2,3-dioxygenase-like lactoylglutathione lyase family enzyme